MSSFFQVALSSDEVSSMVVKVYTKSNGRTVKAAMRTHSETESEVSERKMIWKLEANTAYMVSIEYAGDMYNRLYETEPCAYFDMTIMVNSLHSLGKKLSCNSSP